MASKKPELSSEWSHFIDAGKIGNKPMLISIGPNAEERKLLAQRLGVLAIHSLNARLSLVRDPGKMPIHVTGSFDAEVEQACVISGEPCYEKIKEDFEAWFADQDKAIPFAKARQERLSKKGQVEMPLLDESEDPEPLIDGHVDAGELVTQYLSLAIDPYPHVEGASLPETKEGEKLPKPEIRTNPFAALKDWKAGCGKE